MKFSLLLIALAVCSASAIQDSQWKNFKAQHGKVYSSIAEEVARYLFFSSFLSA